VRDGAQRGDVGTGVGDELLAAVDHPFMITSVARVRVAPASDPASGSVRPKAPARARPQIR
jgi:hypothetical protein